MITPRTAAGREQARYFHTDTCPAASIEGAEPEDYALCNCGVVAGVLAIEAEAAPLLREDAERLKQLTHLLPALSRYTQEVAQIADRWLALSATPPASAPLPYSPDDHLLHLRDGRQPGCVQCATPPASDWVPSGLDRRVMVPAAPPASAERDAVVEGVKASLIHIYAVAGERRGYDEIVAEAAAALDALRAAEAR